MRIAVISMTNRLLSGAIVKYLQERSELMPMRINDETKGKIYDICKAHDASVLLMEVTKLPPFTLSERLEAAAVIRRELGTCKIALLCDDKADPDTAERIKEAKKLGLIDNFFYNSVSGEYLSAALDTL